MSARTQILIALLIGLVCLGLFFVLAEQNIILTSHLWRIPKILFVVAFGWLLHAAVLVGYLVLSDKSSDSLIAKIRRYAAVYPSDRWWDVVRECERRAKR